MVDGNTTAHSAVYQIGCQGIHSDHIRAQIHKLRVPSPPPFAHGIAVQGWEFGNLLIHLLVRSI
jgi:hypothetical protein